MLLSMSLEISFLKIFVSTSLGQFIKNAFDLCCIKLRITTSTAFTSCCDVAI